MASLKKLLVLLAAISACTTTSEAFPNVRNAGAYFLNKTRNVWKKEPAATLSPRNVAQPLKLIDMIPSLAEDRNVKLCQKGNLGRGHPKKWSNYHEICAFPFDRTPASENATLTREVLLERLNESARRAGNFSSGEYYPRSEFKDSTFDSEGGKVLGTTEWSANPGISIERMDACQLCTSINDNYVVPRGYIRKDGGHQCVCKKWAKGDEKFMLCNCDLCDAFTIPSGLREYCMDMVIDREMSNMLSRYAAFNDHNAFMVQYNDWKDIGKAMDFAIVDIQKDLSVCKSGVQGKKSEDKHRVLHEVPARDKCPQFLESLEDVEISKRRTHQMTSGSI
ncbi:hypothetical protein L207DRAFT_520527 [Hyaloscypha variabilis F]|uniref:Uncharacterized protein n=1 Tax=Hyaloscypha variabilis (strain UAMH 11265 / GT02V1 / F) TaxID=1149755 RepID=A0A2J6QV51_HYAVF|nr:hypothetical protein L207DRAFT_520527 [Hyaloscypha variabilis F]